MEQLGTTKSVFYGVVMIIILMISSCDFGLNSTELSVKHPKTTLSGTNS